MKKLRISKIWIAVVVIVIVAVAAWAMSGGKKEEDINFKEEKVALKTLQNSVTATGTHRGGDLCNRGYSGEWYCQQTLR